MHSPPGSRTLRAAGAVYLRDSRRSGCDLKSVFDTVNHDRLMGELRTKIQDRQVLRLVRAYLQAGVMLPDGSREATPLGVPQGGPLSPLLANIVLTPLDRELEARGHKFARYADDFIVMVKTAGSTTSGSATATARCWNWPSGSAGECGYTTGSNGAGAQRRRPAEGSPKGGRSPATSPAREGET